MRKTIVILTTGQPSTNPRMVKEYLALKEEGYTVKVLYSFWEKWAIEADKKLFESGELNRADFTLVGGSPFENRPDYYFSKLLYKSYAYSYLKFGKQRNNAISRTTALLTRKAKYIKADLYIAHNPGALPSAVIAAKKQKAKAGFDAEDYHRGEYKDQDSKAARLLIAIENKFIPQCHYLTAAAPLIAEAYKHLYNKSDVTCINNSFSKRFLQVVRNNNEKPLTLFWFSQTIGANRGLETVVKALEILREKCEIELHLLGNISVGFDKHLLEYITNKKSVHFHSPVSPDKIFDIAKGFDIGLSIEEPTVENRDLCLTNKIFTYLLSGNAIIYSDTKAQKNFYNSYPASGFIFKAGDKNQLANTLIDLYNNRNKVSAAKLFSLAIAEKQLNWEVESVRFKMLIKQTIR